MKTLAHRLLTKAKLPTAIPNAPPMLKPYQPRHPILDSSQNPGLLRRPFYKGAAVPPEPPTLPIGGKLIERIRGLFGERVGLGGLFRPPPPPSEAAAEPVDHGADIKLRPPQQEATAAVFNVEDARKVLRAAQIEAARSRLQSDPRSSISYQELVQVCREASSEDEAPSIALSLDKSSTVIVFGDKVFLRPDQLAREMERVIASVHELKEMEETEVIASCHELKEMEERKAAIDEKAAALARMELRCGLGFLVAETAGFMALTFWYLSWDVMEPICFFNTAIYGMVVYVFSLKTNKEPSMENIFEVRFAAKQRKFMKARGFDLKRYNELKMIHGSCHCSKREVPCRERNRENMKI